MLVSYIDRDNAYDIAASTYDIAASTYDIAASTYDIVASTYDIAASTCDCVRLCVPRGHVLKTCNVYAGPFCSMVFMCIYKVINKIHSYRVKQFNIINIEHQVSYKA